MAIDWAAPASVAPLLLLRNGECFEWRHSSNESYQHCKTLICCNQRPCLEAQGTFMPKWTLQAFGSNRPFRIDKQQAPRPASNIARLNEIAQQRS